MAALSLVRLTLINCKRLILPQQLLRVPDILATSCTSQCIYMSPYQKKNNSQSTDKIVIKFIQKSLQTLNVGEELFCIICLLSSLSKCVLTYEYLDPSIFSKFEVQKSGNKDYLSGDVTGIATVLENGSSIFLLILHFYFSIFILLFLTIGDFNLPFTKNKSYKMNCIQNQSQKQQLRTQRLFALTMKGREESKTFYYQSFY